MRVQQRMTVVYKKKNTDKLVALELLGNNYLDSISRT